MASREVSIDVRGVPEVKELIANLPSETARLIAAAIRAHCTPPTEAYTKGGDFLIYAVADWIENPPEWVNAPWVKQATPDSGGSDE